MIRAWIYIAVIFVLSACTPAKSLPGGFALEKWEDGVTFYLIGPGNLKQDGGGAIEGTVLRLAWNSDIIAADRYATFRGDPDGWMIIDTKAKRISGPISETEFERLKELHRLRVMTAQDAWNVL